MTVLIGDIQANTTFDNSRYNATDSIRAGDIGENAVVKVVNTTLSCETIHRGARLDLSGCQLHAKK